MTEEPTSDWSSLSNREAKESWLESTEIKIKLTLKNALHGNDKDKSLA